MHYFLGMEVWQNIPRTREVCSRYPEEVLDDGLQVHDHTYGIKPEAIECCFTRDGRCYDVSSNDWFLDVPDEYETKYLFFYEHINLVADRSETCSPDCCKAYFEVPIGYS